MYVKQEQHMQIIVHVHAKQNGSKTLVIVVILSTDVKSNSSILPWKVSYMYLLKVNLIKTL